MDQEVKLYSVRKAAEQIGIGGPTLYRYIQRGVVQTEQSTGGNLRISSAEIERLKDWIDRDESSRTARGVHNRKAS